MGLVDGDILGDGEGQGYEREGFAAILALADFGVSIPGIPKVGVERRDEVAEIGVRDLDVAIFSPHVRFCVR